MQHIIHIQWDGPHTLDQLATLHNDADYGVYQIYGGHPVYGSNVLLYIGKAEIQTFGTRIPQHGYEHSIDGKAVLVYVGRLAGGRTPADEVWGREIALAERLLIYAHTPAANSKSIASIPDADLQDIHVINWGQHRDLMPEVSGARWTTKFDGIENYEAYGTHETGVDEE